MSQPNPATPGHPPAANPTPPAAAQPTSVGHGNSSTFSQAVISLAAVALLIIGFAVIAPLFKKPEMSVADQVALIEAKAKVDREESERRVQSEINKVAKMAEEARKTKEAELATEEKQLKIRQEDDRLAAEKAKRDLAAEERRLAHELALKDKELEAKSWDVEDHKIDVAEAQARQEADRVARLNRLRGTTAATLGVETPSVTVVAAPQAPIATASVTTPTMNVAKMVRLWNPERTAFRVVPEAEAIASGAGPIMLDQPTTRPTRVASPVSAPAGYVILDGKLVREDSLTNPVHCTPARCGSSAPPPRHREPEECAPRREEGPRTCVNQFLNNLFNGNTVNIISGPRDSHRECRPSPRRRITTRWCPQWRF